MPVTSLFQANSIFGSFIARSCMNFDARRESLRWMTVTLSAKR